MTETGGTVVRLEGAYAWVRAEVARNACGTCERKEACHGSSTGTILDGVPGQSGHLLRLANTINAQPGDAVVILAADGMLLRAVWLAYGMPLLLALLGATALKLLVGSEVAAVLGALLGLGGGYLLMRAKGLDSVRSEPIFSIGSKRSPLNFHEV